MVRLFSCCCLFLFLAAAFGAGNVSTTKVGFVYGNFPNDLSWTYSNDLARAFLEFSRPQVKTKYLVADFGCNNLSTSAIRSMAQREYELIITSSSSFETCTREISDEFPSKNFLSLGGVSANGRNFGSIFGRMYEARWVIGVLSGLVTKSKKIGYIGSVPFFQDYSDVNAAVLGLHSVCPECKLYHYYAGDFYKPAEDAYAAQQLIEVEGCDVLMVLHDAFDHIPVARKHKVPTFGIDADQSSVAPEIIVTSSYWNWGPMLLRFVDQWTTAGVWPGDFIYWGFRENAIGLAAIENVDDSVFARGLAEVERITESELVNGTSWIFCEQKWESHIQDLIQNKNMNISKCLNVSEILTMNYFVDGVVQKGFVSIPKKKGGVPGWGWVIIAIGIILVVALVAGLGYLLFYRRFHLIIVPRSTVGDDNEWSNPQQ